MKLKFTLLVLLCLFSNSFLFSQNQEINKEVNDSTKEEKKSFFTASTTFNTNSGFAGRVENTFNPAIGALVGYSFKSGIYLNAEADLNPKQSVLFGGFSLEGGYGFNVIEDLVTADVCYTHYFAQNESKILSEIQGSAHGTLTCDLDWVSLEFTPTYNYGSKVGDVLLTFEINKDINLFAINKDTVSITPGIKSYAGTQKLLQLHVNKKLTKKSIATAALNAEYSKFNYLNTDIEIPISYTHKAFTFEVTPTLSLPTNLVQTTRFISNPLCIEFSVAIKI